MNDPRLDFPIGSQGAPVAGIRPCLEAVVSVRLGDDPGRVGAFWERLTGAAMARARHVCDHCSPAGPQRAADGARSSVHRAFKIACQGPDQGPAVDWAALAFSDTAEPDQLAGWSATCSIGWIAEPTAPRGFSLRMTTPTDHPWGDLLELGRELASEWPGLWRWITVGPRFIPLSPASPQYELSRREVFARARRFVLVDVGEPLGLYTTFWQERLRTVAWGTLISSELAGEISIEGSIHPRLVVMPLRAGLLLRAGEQPILGDINRAEDLSVYLAMDRRLRAIRATSGVNFLAPWDAESSAAWLDRLEAVGPDGRGVEA